MQYKDKEKVQSPCYPARDFSPTIYGQIHGIGPFLHFKNAAFRQIIISFEKKSARQSIYARKTRSFVGHQVFFVSLAQEAFSLLS